MESPVFSVDVKALRLFKLLFAKTVVSFKICFSNTRNMLRNGFKHLLLAVVAIPHVVSILQPTPPMGEDPCPFQNLRLTSFRIP